MSTALVPLDETAFAESILPDIQPVTILVPLAGSRRAEQAVALAAALATQWQGLLVLVPIGAKATGEVHAKGVRSAPSTVLHPWLQDELTAFLATMPEVTVPEAERPEAARWATWLAREPREPLPPLRLILIWDNLAGHLSVSMVRWLFQQGIMPLYTPLSGFWLNLAESPQRIVVRRALSGQHRQTPEEIITWLEDTVAAWNEDPTPFIWGSKRHERRERARQHGLGGSPAVLPDHHSNAA